MRKFFSIPLLTLYSFLLFQACTHQDKGIITPNQFEGCDIERIQAAVDMAAKITGKVVIPATNENGSGIWLIDSAILLPGNMTVILDNCTIQLSDSCRDNMFRSDNVGIGITDPHWNQNIHIVGVGHVVLQGADNPRATGDAAKKLSRSPDKDIEDTGNYHISYGTDAGKEGMKQTGDWRNIMILMAYVKNFTLTNVTIKNAHGWAISNERVVDAAFSDIRIYSPAISVIDSMEKMVRNRDGIDIRNGCKHFRINNISGKTGDDFIALSLLQGFGNQDMSAGSLHSTMVTSRVWKGLDDDISDIYITNIQCQSDTRAIAIRANDESGIHDLFINGVISKGGYNALLFSGKGYGPPSKPGKINNVHVMNFMGDGESLIRIDAPIADCSFMDGLYLGNGDQIIGYHIDQDKTENIVTQGLTRINE